MSIAFITQRPNALLVAFRNAIKQLERDGKITTWVEDSDAFTHAAPEWKWKAWLVPEIMEDCLRFTILCPDGSNIDAETYGFYHGRLTETFLSYFDDVFTYSHSTAMPAIGDVVSPPDRGQPQGAPPRTSGC